MAGIEGLCWLAGIAGGSKGCLAAVELTCGVVVLGEVAEYGD